MLYDLEEPTWSDKIPGQCDLVHVRLLFGCLKTELWPQFYINAFEYGPFSTPLGQDSRGH